MQFAKCKFPFFRHLFDIRKQDISMQNKMDGLHSIIILLFVTTAIKLHHTFRVGLSLVIEINNHDNNTSSSNPISTGVQSYYGL